MGVGRCGWQGAGRSKAGGTAAAGHLAAQTAKAGSGQFLLRLELKPYLECEHVTFLLKLLLVMGVQLWRQVRCRSWEAPWCPCCKCSRGSCLLASWITIFKRWYVLMCLDEGKCSLWLLVCNWLHISQNYFNTYFTQPVGWFNSLVWLCSDTFYSLSFSSSLSMSLSSQPHWSQHIEMNSSGFSYLPCLRFVSRTRFPQKFPWTDLVSHSRAWYC